MKIDSTMDDEAKWIWIISDGKPGHFNQTMGLAEAMKRLNNKLEIDVLEIGSGGILSRYRKLKTALSERKFSPRPMFILGAGTRTHLAVFYLSRKFGAKSILCMRPSLPWSWFDRVIVPQHDLENGKCPQNVIPVQGALNRILPQVQPISDPIDLVLIGGPSKEYAWDSQKVIEQLKLALAMNQEPKLRVVATTSRRTPKDFVDQCGRAGLEMDLVPVEKTDKNWVKEHLAKARRVWVTRESVSMIYEALSSGARVGLLDLPLKKGNEPSRVGRGICRLESQGKFGNVEDATFFSSEKSPCVLQEAQRVARILENGN